MKRCRLSYDEWKCILSKKQKIQYIDSKIFKGHVSQIDILDISTPQLWNVQEYKPSDCPAIAQLFYDTVHTVNARDYTKEQLAAWAIGTIDPDAWNLSFLEHDTLTAEIDGEIVGFADMDNTGYLDRIYIHRYFQGMGIASSLIGELERHAREAGITCFETYSSVTARPFFEKQGYTVETENRVIRNNIPLINYKMIKHS